MATENDFRRLKDEADMEVIVDYCGIEKGKRIGSAQFVKCPNPDHDDMHPTNAYYRKGWNTIYCTTCNKNFGPIDVIMWSLNMNYGEAADLLWELEGRPDWYYAKRQAETERQFSVSISELELLGIQIPNTHYIPVRFTKYREFDSEQMKAGFRYQFVGNGYLLVKSVQANWTDFLSRDNMQRLVLAKCRKLLKELDKIENHLGKTGLFADKREKINELMERAQRRVA